MGVKRVFMWVANFGPIVLLPLKCVSCNNTVGQAQQALPGALLPAIKNKNRGINYRNSSSQGFKPVCFLKAVLKCEMEE